MNLQNVGFYLPERVKMSLKRLFGDHGLPHDVLEFQVPTFYEVQGSGKKSKRILMRQQLNRQITMLLPLF